MIREIIRAEVLSKFESVIQSNTGFQLVKNVWDTFVHINLNRKF